MSKLTQNQIKADNIAKRVLTAMQATTAFGIAEQRQVLASIAIGWAMELGAKPTPEQMEAVAERLERFGNASQALKRLRDDGILVDPAKASALMVASIFAEVEAASKPLKAEANA